MKQGRIWAVLFATGACAGNGDSESESNSTDTEACLVSRWEGDLDYAGQDVFVVACLGADCTMETAVPIKDGTSCRFDGPPPMAGETEPPDPTAPQPGQVWGSVAMADQTEVRICALRSGDGGGTVHLRVTLGGGYPGGEGGTMARLVVGDEEGEVVADPEVMVPPPEDGSRCSPFAVDLDGAPLESGPYIF